jgi:tripartite-type tricarboxylate transporter receptor subunit TctC
VKNAVLGGTIQIAAMNMGEGVGDFRQGVLRPLGQMAVARWANTPEVPTFREQGFDVVEGSMRGLAAPAGVAPAVLARFADVVRKVMEDAEFKRLADQQQLPLRYLNPDQHRAALVALSETYRRLWAQHPWRE